MYTLLVHLLVMEMWKFNHVFATMNLASSDVSVDGAVTSQPSRLEKLTSCGSHTFYTFKVNYVEKEISQHKLNLLLILCEFVYTGDGEFCRHYC